MADGNYWINATSVTYPTNTTVNATNATLSLTIDNTAPTMVVYGTAPTAYANSTIRTTTAVASANLTLSIYVTDATIGMANNSIAVCFVSVGTGINHTIPMFSTSRTTGWCNSSNTNASTALNLSGLGDGNSTIKIYVNDTITNLLNATLVAHIDTTNPTATATCSPSSVQAGSSFPCTCTTSDATSGINSASSGGSSTSPQGVGTPSSTGVFTYTCSAVDNGGLTASATATYAITQQGTGSPSSSLGTTWITQTITDSVFTQGYTAQLRSKNRIKVQIASQDHYIGVLSLTGTNATIQISSNPINITLSAGQNATVDVDNDGFYDIYVLLNSIINNKANLTVKKIHDAVPPGGSAVQTSGETGEEEEQEEEGEEPTSLTWLWVLIAVVILAAIVWVVVKKNK